MGSNSPKGFTLIELLVVISVIGLLASVVLVSMTGVREKARVAEVLRFSQNVYHILGSEAVGVWSFEEGSGTTALDGSGFNNTGTITGADYSSDTPHNVVGRGDRKYSLSFDGSDYVDCGSDKSLKLSGSSLGYTVEAWAKLSAKGTDRVVTSKGDSKAALVWYDIGEDDWRAHASGVYARWTEESPLLNKWYHIVNIWDGNELSIWVNGTKGAITGTLNSITNDASDPFIIGARGGGSSMRFVGLIDEVKVYKKAMLVGEIRKRYVEGLAERQLVRH